LADLDPTVGTPSVESDACWSRINAAVDAALAKIDAMSKQSTQGRYRSAIDAVERRYSGLAAPEAVELRERHPDAGR